VTQPQKLQTPPQHPLEKQNASLLNAEPKPPLQQRQHRQTTHQKPSGTLQTLISQ
jgi:hypothetical protein